MTVLLTAKTDWKMFCVLAIRCFVTSLTSAGLNASLPTPIIKQDALKVLCASDYSKHSGHSKRTNKSEFILLLCLVCCLLITTIQD